MAYSDFTLERVKKEFGLTISSREDLFADVSPIEYSDSLKETLSYNIPIALASNTEKARSEMIIAPILLELTRLSHRQVSLFSGVDFTVEPERGLNGSCDFLLTRSPDLLIVTAPAIAVVEAKKENIKGGLGQCIAEMVAAQIFNQREKAIVPIVYGVVTTGEIWRFLHLEGAIAQVDVAEYFLNDVGKILGILSQSLE